MPDGLLSVLMLAAALGSGMMAGLYFVFSVAVMSALGRLPPAGGIAAMQSINRVILNPWFFLLFFGTAAVCLALAIGAVLAWQAPASATTMAGSLLYLAGNLLVTVLRNVPLNKALAAVDPASGEAAHVWACYLDVWTKWNHVRTLACLLAAGLFTFALQVRGDLSHG
ncbi:MAG TPA: anthrone oxygenase family protein [Azospirillum sp.]|nr:anthrone oxygenase family protein [Azospirillum sp.]